jgi:hypothetical protein
MEAPWLADFLHEIVAFPNGKYRGTGRKEGGLSSLMRQCPGRRLSATLGSPGVPP